MDFDKNSYAKSSEAASRAYFSLELLQCSVRSSTGKTTVHNLQRPHSTLSVSNASGHKQWQPEYIAHCGLRTPCRPTQTTYRLHMKVAEIDHLKVCLPPHSCIFSSFFILVCSLAHSFSEQTDTRFDTLHTRQ